MLMLTSISILTLNLSMNYISAIIKENKLSIIFTYSTILIEIIGISLLPGLLGVTLNQLFEKNYIFLVYYVAFFLFLSLISFFRQLYDTRVYSKIQSDLCVKIVEDQYSKQIEKSKIVGRTNFIKSIVNFVEFNIPQIATNIVSFLVSLLILYFYGAQYFFLCIFLILPMWILTRKYAPLIAKANHIENNVQEKHAGVIYNGVISDVKLHYNRLRFLEIKISNLNAFHFGFNELFVSVVYVLTLLFVTADKSMQIGTVYAIISYVWRFIGSMDSVPYTIRQIHEIKDVESRLTEENGNQNLELQIV